MAKRRTKLANTPRKDLRTSKKKPYDYTKRGYTKELDLNKDADFKKYIATLKTRPDYFAPRLKELINLAESSPRKIIKGQVVIFVNEFKDPDNKLTPADIKYGLIFVCKTKPKKWQRFIMNHEIDELILRKADYGFKSKHFIARRREKQNLERKGELIPFMRWLKEHYPSAFEERLKVWKIPRGSIK